jgi:hypothetical protein
MDISNATQGMGEHRRAAKCAVYFSPGHLPWRPGSARSTRRIACCCVDTAALTTPRRSHSFSSSLSLPHRQRGRTRRGSARSRRPTRGCAGRSVRSSGILGPARAGRNVRAHRQRDVALSSGATPLGSLYPTTTSRDTGLAVGERRERVAQMRLSSDGALFTAVQVSLAGFSTAPSGPAGTIRRAGHCEPSQGRGSLLRAARPGWRHPATTAPAGRTGCWCSRRSNRKSCSPRDRRHVSTEARVDRRSTGRPHRRSGRRVRRA